MSSRSTPPVLSGWCCANRRNRSPVVGTEKSDECICVGGGREVEQRIHREGHRRRGSATRPAFTSSRSISPTVLVRFDHGTSSRRHTSPAVKLQRPGEQPVVDRECPTNCTTCRRTACRRAGMSSNQPSGGYRRCTSTRSSRCGRAGSSRFRSLRRTETLPGLWRKAPPSPSRCRWPSRSSDRTSHALQVVNARFRQRRIRGCGARNLIGRVDHGTGVPLVAVSAAPQPPVTVLSIAESAPDTRIDRHRPARRTARPCRCGSRRRRPNRPKPTSGSADRRNSCPSRRRKLRHVAHEGGDVVEGVGREQCRRHRRAVAERADRQLQRLRVGGRTGAAPVLDPVGRMPPVSCTGWPEEPVVGRRGAGVEVGGVGRGNVVRRAVAPAIAVAVDVFLRPAGGQTRRGPRFVDTAASRPAGTDPE